MQKLWRKDLFNWNDTWNISEKVCFTLNIVQWTQLKWKEMERNKVFVTGDNSTAFFYFVLFSRSARSVKMQTEFISLLRRALFYYFMYFWTIFKENNNLFALRVIVVVTKTHMINLFRLFQYKWVHSVLGHTNKQCTLYVNGKQIKKK